MSIASPALKQISTTEPDTTGGRADDAADQEAPFVLSGWHARREQQLRDRINAILEERRREDERHLRARRDPKAAEQTWHRETLATLQAERDALTAEGRASEHALRSIQERIAGEHARHEKSLLDPARGEDRRHRMQLEAIDRRRLKLADEYVQFLGSLRGTEGVGPETVVEALRLEEGRDDAESAASTPDAHTGLLGRVMNTVVLGLPLNKLIAASQNILRATYTSTFLGWPWIVIRSGLAVLVPAFTATIFLNNIVGVEAGQTPYLLFAVIGMSIWYVFEYAVVLGTRSRKFAKRVRAVGEVPEETLIVLSAVPPVVDLFIFILVTALLGIWFWLTSGVFPFQFGAHTFFLPIGICLALAIAVGVTNFTSVLIGNMRDLRAGLRYLLRFWFILTPVVYPTHILPADWQWLTLVNPMRGPVELVKFSVLGDQSPVVTEGVISAFACAVVLLVAGRLFLAWTRAPAEVPTRSEEDDEEDQIVL